METYEATVSLSPQQAADKIRAHILNSISGECLDEVRRQVADKTLIAMVFAVVAILMFHIVLSQTFDMVEINPAFPISLSVVIVIGFIAAIIACQVRKIMKVDPSEILVKE